MIGKFLQEIAKFFERTSLLGLLLHGWFNLEEMLRSFYEVFLLDEFFVFFWMILVDSWEKLCDCCSEVFDCFLSLSVERFFLMVRLPVNLIGVGLLFLDLVLFLALLISLTKLLEGRFTIRFIHQLLLHFGWIGLLL